MHRRPLRAPDLVLDVGLQGLAALRAGRLLLGGRPQVETLSELQLQQGYFLGEGSKRVCRRAYKGTAGLPAWCGGVWCWRELVGTSWLQASALGLRR
jgi:hypothetical protein